MVINLLLLAVLFVAGLVNIFFYFPRKKIHAWFQSLFLKPTHEATSASTAQQTVPDKEKLELKLLFETFDKNRDGFITKEELMESMMNMRIRMTEQEVEEMVARADANRDGLVDFEEFCKLNAGMAREEGERKVEKELKEAFEVFDEDRDGFISADELGVVLRALGAKEWRIQDCRRMIEKVDADGDGMVNFDEFKKMMQQQSG